MVVKKQENKVKKNIILDQRKFGEAPKMNITKIDQKIIEKTKYFLFMELLVIFGFFGFDFIDDFN